MSSVCYFPGMNDLELNELRIALLKAAIGQVSDGNVSAFGRRLGYKDGAFVRQMLSGARPVTEKTIRSVEFLPGMKGWFSSASATTPPTEGAHIVSTDDLSISGQKQDEITFSPGAEDRTIGAPVEAAKMTSPQRLRAALSGKGHTASEVASVAGVGIDTASQWLAGEGLDITLAQAVAIQNTYGVNAVWITKGKGEPGVAIRYADEYRPIPITNWKAIPVVGMAQLGDNGHWSDLEYPVGHGDGYVDFPSKDPDAYALKCEGDSMRPRIKDGEFVVIEPNHPIEPGDEVLLKSKDGRVMVKEFLYKRAGRTHLISVNDAHPQMSFTDQEIDKMHYVCAICRPSTWRQA